MKNRNLLSLVILTICSQVFFSCNTTRQYDFANRSGAYHSEQTLVKTEPSKETLAPETLPEEITASTEMITPIVSKPLIDLRQEKPQVQMNNKIAATGTEQIAVTNSEKKELKQALKLYKKQLKTQGTHITAQPTVDIVELIFAIILPPVGVLLHDGGISTRFWISLVLTLLFFFPGMIYAILVVTDTI